MYDGYNFFFAPGHLARMQILEPSILLSNCFSFLLFYFCTLGAGFLGAPGCSVSVTPKANRTGEEERPHTLACALAVSMNVNLQTGMGLSIFREIIDTETRGVQSALCDLSVYVFRPCSSLLVAARPSRAMARGHTRHMSPRFPTRAIC